MTDKFKSFGEDRFTVTEDHLKLVRQMYFSYDDYCEFGAPVVDPKRPYGNSDVFADIAEILLGKDPYDQAEGVDDWLRPHEEEFMKLHRETATVLEIAARTGKFEVGNYRTPKYHSEWEKVDA